MLSPSTLSGTFVDSIEKKILLLLKKAAQSGAAAQPDPKSWETMSENAPWQRRLAAVDRQTHAVQTPKFREVGNARANLTF